MEKLIELLNEYEPSAERKQDGDLIVRSWYTDGYELFDAYIISKQFGFIKRLVDNDKIDFKKNKLQVLKDIDVRGEVMYDYTLFDKADGVLMLLAIQDDPVKFLSEVLKDE